MVQYGERQRPEPRQKAGLARLRSLTLPVPHRLSSLSSFLRHFAGVNKTFLNHTLP